MKNAKKRGSTLTRVGILMSVAVIAIGMVSIVFSQSSERQSAAARSSSVADKRMPNLEDLTPPAVNDTRTYVAERKIIIDAKTGKLRMPTPGEVSEMIASLRSLTNRSSEGLTATTHPDGTRQVNLKGRFNSVVVARANADGTMETRCVSTLDEATAFLSLRPETDTEKANRKPSKKTTK
ncbi:MAG TPA: hypothetical protein VNI02_15990 [Blastocatellia bacterium]|jgi:hypothetical protein|nr:hypothetical protein [Blastocatellia bacterium]